MDHLSVSQVNVYRACSLKYRFSYVDTLPKPFKPSGLAFGSVVHSAIEWWHKEVLKEGEPTLERAHDVLLADWQAMKVDNVRLKDGETEEALLAKALGLVDLYLSEPAPAKVLHAEMPFEVPIVNIATGEMLEVPLRGVIDMIEEPETIVELKTAARVMDTEDIRQNLQLTGYSYAHEMIYKRPAKLRLDCLLKTRKPRLERFEAKRSEADYVKFFCLLKEVWKGITNEVFFPNPGWMCKECEYSETCRLWGMRH